MRAVGASRKCDIVIMYTVFAELPGGSGALFGNLVNGAILLTVRASHNSHVIFAHSHRVPHGFSASLLLNFIAFIPPPSPFSFALPRCSILSSSSPLSAASAFLSLSLIDPIAFLSSAAARACVCSCRTLSFHFASFCSLPCTRLATAIVTSRHSLEEQVGIVGIPLAFSAFLIGALRSLHRRSFKCAATVL